MQLYTTPPQDVTANHRGCELAITRTYPVYMTPEEMYALLDILKYQIEQMKAAKDESVTDRATFSTPEQLLEFLADMDIDQARVEAIQTRVQNAVERS